MLERLLGAFPEVIQLLRDDHKLVRSLFAQYAKASNGGKPQIAHRIIRELTIHAAIEERVVYPAFRAVFQDPGMIYKAVEEHQLVRALLDKLNKFRPGPRFGHVRRKVQGAQGPGQTSCRRRRGPGLSESRGS